jgi:hypothetical protein
MYFQIWVNFLEGLVMEGTKKNLATLIEMPGELIILYLGIFFA